MIEILSLLSSPAQRVLSNLGINSLSEITKYTRFEIENLHGIGKNALMVIEGLLLSNDLDYKNEENSQEVDNYINQFDGNIKDKLSEMRKVIRSVIPKAKEKIAYGMPTYYYSENVVHFAGFKNHIGFFPTPNGVSEFEEDFKIYKKSKGGIQFQIDEELPIKLIIKIVEFRYKEIKARLEI
jgi:uncharacterized protein YdhG (YjbR/CyaY superfamily)